MYINPFSIVMSIVLFTIISTVCSLFLTRTKSRHLWLVSFLLVLCVLRMLIPIEIGHAYDINVWAIYPDLLALMSSNLYKTITVWDCLCFLWLSISFILLIREVYRLIGQLLLIKSTRHYQTIPRITRITHSAADAVGCKSLVRVYVTRDFSSPIMISFLRPIILIPPCVVNLDDRKLEYILRHEISHYVGGDLWCKLGMNFLVCLLWWNPSVYLLRQSVDQLLELKSDQRASHSLSDEEKVTYSFILLEQLQKAINTDQNFVSAGLIGIYEKKYLRQRIKFLIDPPRRKPSTWMTGLIVCICALLYIGSYTFILQPAALPDTENDASMVILTPENAWLVPTNDNQYEVWVDGNYYAVIPSEYISMPPFDQLPIHDKESIQG